MCCKPNPICSYPDHSALPTKGRRSEVWRRGDQKGENVATGLWRGHKAALQWDHLSGEKLQSPQEERNTFPLLCWPRVQHSDMKADYQKAKPKADYQGTFVNCLHSKRWKWILNAVTDASDLCKTFHSKVMGISKNINLCGNDYCDSKLTLLTQDLGHLHWWGTILPKDWWPKQNPPFPTFFCLFSLFMPISLSEFLSHQWPF